ncbi:SDR family NAD(P)-dependent oxidoreductase [Yinghuangia soli]|uniref:SDR family oxidoreductase n=1 Tax=Yinghuangia soli TaxID=2908204 RepID=A0AA41QAX4_9ACTN|nr:SDR family oxidoreductase [Yinghuangia soli]MCF2533427.1 SDR family oxidoreductase [Yinghuangia soli]
MATTPVHIPAALRRTPVWFRGRTALVTGGSRGLGLLIARELAAAGARVAICARDKAELGRAADQIENATGHRPAVFVCDLGEPDRVDELVADLGEHFGDLDALVNNAGIISVAPLEALTPEQFQSAMDVMFLGPMRLTLALLPGLRARDQARIANVTSLGGRIAAPHLLPYACAKFAAVGFSEGLRAETAGTGIAVTTVVPGLMRTGSHRAARFGGRAEREYAWFAAAASMPLLSMDAERAARAIVRAAARGRAELVLTPAAKAAVLAHGVAPATTGRFMALAARALPDAPPEAPAGEDLPGIVARAGGTAAWVRKATVLGERAARRFNEPRAT